MVLVPLLLISATVTAAEDSNFQVPTAGEVVARMMARDAERQANLHGYTAMRRYVLENQRHHKRAEMVVRMTCQPDGSKQFETISASGWAGARKHVFPRLLEAESDASRPGVRDKSRITPENYRFELVGTEYLDERLVYVLTLSAKTPDKYLLEGRIWVDADEYAIIHIEGKPAKNPSFWIKSTHFVHDYEKRDSVWFPVSDRSVTDVRIFGSTDVTIEYFAYDLKTSSLTASCKPLPTRTP